MKNVEDGVYITEADAHEPQALAVMPPPAALQVSRPPEVVLREAREVAQALIDVIKSKPELTVKLNGHDFLKFEAWQTIGKFYGASVKVTETKYVEMGEVAGIEAKAVVLNHSGMEVSGAEAMCLNDEPNWKKKPLFQLKSMAQTRASAKALRNVFAWVVVLAGYKPTPAEEMDGVKAKAEKEPELQTAEGVVEGAMMSGGSLWFRMGEDTFSIPPMRGQDMKSLLEQADKAFVELKVSKAHSAKANKDYFIVKEIVKFEPECPF
jgi:hypothetical protein